VTVTNAAGCSAMSADKVVTVDPLPATPTISGPSSFCSGTTATLTAPAGYSYSWNTGATTQSIAITAAGTYRVTVTNAAGCSATSADKVVTVDSAPATPLIAGPSSFCSGTTATLTAPAGAATYSWNTGATTQSIAITTGGTYRVTVTNAAGCSATSADKVVTVDSAPATPTIAGPSSFCSGTTATLTAPAGAATYSWNTGATTQSIAITTGGTYRVTVSNPAGCSATSADKVVTVDPLPATPTIAGPSSFCSGTTATLTAPAGAATYSWNTGATTQSIAITAGGTYRVTVTNAAGCSATSADKVVTMNALPATPAISGPSAFCEGSSATLTAPAGFSYSWNTGATTQSITVATGGTYRVTVTNASGCSATSADKVVTQNALPATPVITPVGSTTFCAGGSVRLDAPAGFTYLWNNGANTPSITVSTAGAYRVTVTNANGCSATSADTVVTVNAATSITQQPYSGPVAKNTSQHFTVGVSGTGTFTYQWQKGTSATGPWTTVGTAAAYDTPKLAHGTYWYRVIVTGSCGSATSNVSTLTVN
jgi:hypothetical protein